MLPRLYLIRHGETEWSVTGRHTGSTDIPLTARGEDEARDLGQYLRKVSFDQVLTSPTQRAKRTSELTDIRPAAGIEADATEWNYGDYEGRSTPDITRTHPDWNLFRDGCPGGETPAQVSERADRLIARLRRVEGNVALFTHGHFGRVVGARWIGLDVAYAQHFLLGTASLSVLGYEHDRTDQPVIVRWNAIAQETFDPASGLFTGNTPEGKAAGN